MNKKIRTNTSSIHKFNESPTERKSWFYDTMNKRKCFLLRCLAAFLFNFYAPFVRLRVRTLIWFSFYSVVWSGLMFYLLAVFYPFEWLGFLLLNTHPLPLFNLFRSASLCTHHTLHLLSFICCSGRCIHLPSPFLRNRLEVEYNW